MPFWVSLNIFYLFMKIDEFLGIFITTFAYVRVYVAVRRHKNRIQHKALVGSTLDWNVSWRDQDGSRRILTIYCFLLCFLPFAIFLVCMRTIGVGIPMKIFYLFSVTSILLNSFLNPLIYCWKMRHIRRTVIDIMRSMSWKRIHVPRDHQLRPANWAQTSEQKGVNDKDGRQRIPSDTSEDSVS